MLGTHLHRTLRSLCFNTEWKYAIFWKLKSHDMMLTWEDAYYDHHEQHSLENKSLADGHHMYDPFGLAVAKTSYHTYSLGEGIIGQVAVTGQHQWIFADKHATNTSTSLKPGDGWQTESCAGIRTVVAVAVLPHGVVQLGSLNEVTEDLKLVNHIRNVFYSLQCSPVDSSSFMPDMPMARSSSDVFHNCLLNLDKSSNKGRSDFHPSISPSLRNESNCSYSVRIPSQERVVEVIDAQIGSEFWTSGDEGSSKMFKSEHETGLSCIDSQNTLLKFSTGSELHEVLRSSFLNPNVNKNWEPEEIKAGTAFGMPEGMSQSRLASDLGSDNLLEAVVANVYQGVGEIKSERSFCQSMQSLLAIERDHQASIDQSSNSFQTSSDRSTKGFSSTCLSACSELSEGSIEPSKPKNGVGPGKNCRPRARPRDRQLIQDRIKELRQLVPNGSKGSIDSLLERTIKHMLYMQSITEHADKLKECSESKFYNKGRSMLGSSTYEQGSSWALEVGSHLKVCPITVENLNTNGQLLVEMLCEECSHFLEIAEAIRSMGLTILKGVTEAQGEKTLMCFVVEGMNTGTVHRMDLLCSLVQIMQPKAAQ